MGNNFTSNFTTKLAKGFLAAFESTRVMSKNVNTQLLDGKFKPDSGDTTKFKRPTDFVTVRTSTGDLTSDNPSPIVTGNASGVVQDYFTSYVDFDEADQAIKMDELDALLRPMATRMKTDLELDFSAFMLKNTGLMSGTYGTACSTWDHISEADAVMESHGVPMDRPWYLAVNPYTKRKLASDQRSLGAGGSAGALITEAHKKATICENYGGFDRVMTATTLSSITLAGADRVGAVDGNPIVTYVGAKDTMTQIIHVDGITSGTVINAGEVIQVTGRYRLNLNTRQLILNESGVGVVWTGTVTADATMTGGEGDLIVTGPAIYESGGAYNTCNSAIVDGDIVTILGTAADIVQPNLFWHKDAFSIGSVPIKKLYSTDTVATTADGLQFRVSKGSDFTKNEQNVRIDFRPAYACLNPFFAGQAFGRS